MGSLTGKVAVVTGGGSGIGLSTATRLAAAGASVAIVDLDGDGAERVAAPLDGLALQADVGRSDEWPGIVDAVTRRLRRDRPGPPQRRRDDQRGGHHQGDRRDLRPGHRRQRRRRVLRRARRGPGHGRARWRVDRGDGVAGRPDRLLARPDLLPDEACGGGPRALPRPPVGRQGDHHQRGVPEHRRHPVDRRHAGRPGVERLPADRRGVRLDHRGRPALRRGHRRGHGHPGRTGGAGLPVRPAPGAPGRRDRRARCRRRSSPRTTRPEEGQPGGGSTDQPRRRSSATSRSSGTCSSCRARLWRRVGAERPADSVPACRVPPCGSGSGRLDWPGRTDPTDRTAPSAPIPIGLVDLGVQPAQQGLGLVLGEPAPRPGAGSAGTGPGRP